ncbi:PEP-CTERM sorting domain-containing protein [Haloferula sp.]|uniref:PEP-CTERM sorting domain-containing protein n=1 Tax=Haloferula sp. TaxID=2497595 RepID=UPI00329DA311
MKTHTCSVATCLAAILLAPSALATLLISEDFTSATLSTNARIRTDQSNGNFYTDNDPVSDWTISGGIISNAGTSLTGSSTEGALSQVVSTNALATDLTSLTLSFDYTVGATATLKFALIGYTANLQDGGGTSNILMNNGTSNGALQNNTQAELRHGDINLLTGADMTQSITNDLTFASGTSGSHSVTIDLTGYAWHADEAADATTPNTPGLSGSISSIADFDYVVLVAVNDLSSDVGVTATTLDNIVLEAVPEPSSTLLTLTASGLLLLRRRRD